MKLTAIQIDKTIVRTKKEKIDFLLQKRKIEKSWIEDFIDEDTGEVVSVERKLSNRCYNHPALNYLIFKNFKQAKKC